MLSERGRDVLDHLADFGLLTERHLRAFCFSENSSATPCHRTIQRLMRMRLISRLDIRIVGKRGGNGEFVYRLSPNGLRLCRPSEQYRSKVGNFLHTLAVADVALTIAQMEQAGLLSVVRRDTEPYSWTPVGALDLRPDLRVDVDWQNGERRYYWFEVDLSSERAPQLTAKLELYCAAFVMAWDLDWSSFPVVLWVVEHERRQQALERLVERLPDFPAREAAPGRPYIPPQPAKNLFRVVTFDNLSGALF